MLLSTVAATAFTTATSTTSDCVYYRKLSNGECADACLNSFVGICPVSIVAKSGGLEEGKCADLQYTTVDGTTSQKAGPCGTLTFNKYKKAAVEASQEVTLASFDAEGSAKHQWSAVNDPVMGGQSVSTFTVHKAEKKAVWEGEVKIVPFLKAPGFCNAQTPGLYQTSPGFADVSGLKGLSLRMRTVGTGGLTQFNAMLTTKGSKRKITGQQGTYNANYTIGSEWDDIFVPWGSFSCSWRGQAASWCPELPSQLAEIDSIGVGTAFPGSAGPFHVEISSIKATNGPATLAPALEEQE